MSAPERQCIGCGLRGPQRGFVRLRLDRSTEPARVVVARGGQQTGRSAYLCRRQSCLDRALHRRAFQRAFRATVVIDQEEITAASRAAAKGPDDETGG